MTTHRLYYQLVRINNETRTYLAGTEKSFQLQWPHARRRPQAIFPQLAPEVDSIKVKVENECKNCSEGVLEMEELIDSDMCADSPLADCISR